MEILSKSRKRGCPTCDGIAPKSCMRCHGKTLMRHWFKTDTGWDYYVGLSAEEQKQADIILYSL